jgi:signal peptidase
MYPALRQGDVVVVKQVPPEEVQVGDIIRYQDPNVGVFAVHRVVEIQQDGGAPVFITRGDNLPRNDDPVPGSNMEGKVVFVVPKVGWVSLAMREVFAWVI